MGCHICVTVEDAGKRMADIINLTLISQPWDALVNTWMVFRLDTGESDNVKYESKSDAVDHQIEEKWYCYFCMRRALGGVKARDCQLFINMHRYVYDSGGAASFIEPDVDMIISSRSNDILQKGMNPRGCY
jgi:hypothetical protein